MFQWGKEVKLTQYIHKGTHREDLIHEQIYHNTVEVINTNCPLKYNWPPNIAELGPCLGVRVKCHE